MLCAIVELRRIAVSRSVLPEICSLLTENRHLSRKHMASVNPGRQEAAWTSTRTSYLSLATTSLRTGWSCGMRPCREVRCLSHSGFRDSLLKSEFPFSWWPDVPLLCSVYLPAADTCIRQQSRHRIGAGVVGTCPVSNAGSSKLTLPCVQ